MKLKSIIDKILFYISVPTCVGCKNRLLKDEQPLCRECIKKYENARQRNCSICAKTLDKCSCTNKYLDTHYVHKVIKVFRYVQREDMPQNGLIYSLKRDNRRDVLNYITNEVSNAMLNTLTEQELSQFIFVNVPRRKESYVKYGIDHSALLAKSLAKRFSAEYYQPLISKSEKAQKKTEGYERLKNAKFEIKRNAESLDGKNVIIVDDIITTGASMGACAMLIHGLGAKKIIGVAIAIAYKDKYQPFQRSDN